MAGCSTPPAKVRTLPTPVRDEVERVSSVERFLPLQNDTVFSYTAWLPESPKPEQLILQVERRSPERANLRSGNSVKRIEFVADGVRLLTGGYLLKAPLAAGANWAGPAGRIHVTGMDQTVSVGAGQFVGCIETTETGGQGQSSRSIVTTYCPEVGIVKFSVDAADRQERFELKSYGPRIDINNM
jgi:hypothetical protein